MNTRPSRARVAGWYFPLRVAVAVTAGLVVALVGPSYLAPLVREPHTLVVLSTVLSMIVVATTAWVVLRPVSVFLRALDSALLGLRERDYGLRLVVDRQDELGGLAARFNALGDALRTERSDLYQKEILLETVVESAPLAIVLVDEAGVVALDNATARDLFLGGKKLKARLWDELLAQCPSELREAVAAPDDVIFTLERRGERELYHVSRRWFELSTMPHTLYLLRPMTRELARQEVEVWKKTLRVISHELNNSLAPISSLVHSARKIAATRPEHLYRLDGIFATLEERAQHLATFLESYARFARLPKPIIARVEWRALLERLGPLYPHALPSELPEAPGFFDAGQLEQVLINLLKNAHEAGGPREEVGLRITGNAERGFQIEVWDRGSGMSDEVIRQALVPFYTTKATGTGLGLPLSREILEAHAGTLTIARREGGGTIVTCWLPPALGS